MTFAADYNDRAQQFGFASPERIAQALQDPDKTYVLDVRTPDEIASSGKVHHARWTSTRCTPSACAALEANPQEFVPKIDIDSDDEPTVLVYCRSGRRAQKACEILQAKGYQHVLNAGGYDDVVEIMEQHQS